MGSISLAVFFPLLAAATLIATTYQSETPQNSREQGSRFLSEEIAFPRAEGVGKWATGGRDGQVYIVDNLNDEGPGSFRDAVEADQARMVVFAVSGTVHLKSPVFIQANTTIAGQTAPGQGICLADHPVYLAGDNIILRYLRFRLGDRYQNRGKKPGTGHDDALSGEGRSDIIIDHCSISWSTDECLSIYDGDRTTLQWNIISEPLNNSYHFEESDDDYQAHGYGGIWGGRRLSAHHNLFLHCAGRTPRFNGTRSLAPSELVDFRNNVIYNWGENSVSGGEGGHYNLLNNYYKPGPDTATPNRIVKPFHHRKAGWGSWYIHGNVVHKDKQTTLDNHLGVHFDSQVEKMDKDTLLVSRAFNLEPIATQSADAAYSSVLRHAGASKSRDSLDRRLVEDVRHRSGRIIDVQGGHPSQTPYTISQSAWPKLQAKHPPLDSDQDGMPDAWEEKFGLNKLDPSDSSERTLHRLYTNLEIYIHSMAD